MVWYSVPGFTTIECNELGEVRSTKTQKPRKATYKTKRGSRPKLNISEPDGSRKTAALARIVLSAKLGRTLHDWEEACHIDGNPFNDRMDNLKPASRLNNIIDEYELGRLPIPSAEDISLAITRLEALRVKME